MTWRFLRGAAAAIALAAQPFEAEVAAHRPAVLPFIEDDAPRAMEEARSKKLPVFVEAWAPW